MYAAYDIIPPSQTDLNQKIDGSDRMDKSMTYIEAVSFIEKLPKFSPAGAVSGQPTYNLTSMEKLLELLGNPHKQLHFVHIAGTNGKGSTAAFMQQILTESGLRTGLYTSPALERFTERIRIGTKEISESELADIAERVKAAYDEMGRRGMRYPSQYEFVCAAALLYFAEKHCDIAVLEVGMGGTFDATNVIDVPDLAMITTISPDHTMILGKTLSEIAGAKAGIIKEHGTVLLYPQKSEAEAVFEAVCREKHAAVHHARMPRGLKSCSLDGQIFDLEDSADLRDLKIHLLGSYQINNAAMAAAGAMLLRSKGWPVTDRAIRDGLEKTCWPGRFELMSRNPVVIADGGHNEEGAMALRKSLEQYFPDQKIVFVTGVLADKDYKKMMDGILPAAGQIVTVTPPDPRALSAAELASFLQTMGVSARPAETMQEALRTALREAGTEGIVCIFGSLSFLGEVRKYLPGLLQEKGIHRSHKEAKRSLGFHLQAAREKAGLSVEELANLAEISEQELIRIEAGEADPELSLLFELAELCAADLKDLLNDI